jgi:hypothetical protein
MRFILSIAHLPPIVIKNLEKGACQHRVLFVCDTIPTGSISSKPSGAFLVRLVLIFGMGGEGKVTASEYDYGTWTPTAQVQHLQRGVVPSFDIKSLSFLRTQPHFQSFSSRKTPPLHQGAHFPPPWALLSLFYAAISSSRMSSSHSKLSSSPRPHLETMVSQVFELSRRESAI